MRAALTSAFALLAVVGALFSPKWARAESPPALLEEGPAAALNRNVEAVTVGRAALEAYERGDWQTAYQELSRAESLAHSPVFVLFMARARERAGAWLEALALYERASSEALSESTPEAWRAAAEAARAERASLVARLPSIVVELASSSSMETTVTLDGVALERWGEETLIEPGAHLLIARRADGSETRQHLNVMEGRKRVRVVLGEPTPRAPVTAPTRRAEPRQGPSSVTPAPRSGANHRPTIAYVSGALGVASLVFGAVAGTLAWGELRELEDDCPNDRCDPADRRRLDSVRRLGTMADIGFAAGAAGLGASALLFWLEPPRGASGPAGGVRFVARY